MLAVSVLPWQDNSTTVRSITRSLSGRHFPGLAGARTVSNWWPLSCLLRFAISDAAQTPMAAKIGSSGPFQPPNPYKWSTTTGFPNRFRCLKDYNARKFAADVVAGVTVGLVALPLAMAFAIASVRPAAGRALHCDHCRLSDFCVGEGPPLRSADLPGVRSIVVVYGNCRETRAGRPVHVHVDGGRAACDSWNYRARKRGEIHSSACGSRFHKWNRP